jgi:cellulose synthase/poly-beta-1,6-N-acetylglucosamine synthase-like glycosyltransferase
MPDAITLIPIVLLLCVGAVWWALTALAALGVATQPLLRPLAPDDPRADDVAGRVTALLAARDEAERIEGTVRSLLDQRSVARVVVADDRSADQTPAILARLAGEFPGRLVVERIDALPDGWLGKPHALHRAALHAETDILLFTDADTHMSPGIVDEAASRLVRTDAVHIVTMPGYDASGTFGAACTIGPYLAFIARCAMARFGLPTGVGVGAFNMVERSAYEAAGTHDALRMEVVDDVKLGILLNRHAGPTRITMAPAHVRIDWTADPRTLLKLLEKNTFAMAHFNTALAAWYVFVCMVCWVVGLAAPAALLVAAMTGFEVGTWFVGSAAFAAAGFWSLALPGSWAAGRFGWPLLSAPLVPLCFPTLAAAMAWSAWVTLRQGGIVWRGTHYPLDRLRAEQVW